MTTFSSFSTLELGSVSSIHGLLCLSGANIQLSEELHGAVIITVLSFGDCLEHIYMMITCHWMGVIRIEFNAHCDSTTAG